MPSNRVRKPTAKAAGSPPTTTRPTPVQKRARQRKPSPPSLPRSSPFPSASETSSPPPSTQSAAPIPPTAAYIVEYSIFFKRIELKKNTELSGATGIFSPRVYPSVSKNLAQQKARQEGFTTYLFRNEVSIKLLRGKGNPWSIKWMPVTSLH